jgi:hypothetical protein
MVLDPRVICKEEVLDEEVLNRLLVYALYALEDGHHIFFGDLIFVSLDEHLLNDLKTLHLAETKPSLLTDKLNEYSAQAFGSNSGQSLWSEAPLGRKSLECGC